MATLSAQVERTKGASVKPTGKTASPTLGGWKIRFWERWKLAGEREQGRTQGPKLKSYGLNKLIFPRDLEKKNQTLEIQTCLYRADGGREASTQELPFPPIL